MSKLTARELKKIINVYNQTKSIQKTAKLTKHCREAVRVAIKTALPDATPPEPPEPLSAGQVLALRENELCLREINTIVMQALRAKAASADRDLNIYLSDLIHSASKAFEVLAMTNTIITKSQATKGQGDPDGTTLLFDALMKHTTPEQRGEILAEINSKPKKNEQAQPA